MDGFAHLHVHSEYSLLDGLARIADLVAASRSLGMPALALTDHGNLFGAVHFYEAALEAGVRPILGMEAYISPTTRFDRSMGNIQTAAYHLILLAMNDVGWRNLMRLSSRSYLEGFYYRPRIDRQLLAELNEGLICTTGCLGGEVPTALLSGQADLARRVAGEYRDIFGPERFFIEVQNQNLPDQTKANPLLADLARQIGVGLVGSNDVHFLRRHDKRAHEVLTCIATGKILAQGGALEYSEEVYLKGPEEMRQALADYPAAADNTLRIAEMCDLKLDFSAKHMPRFRTPDGQPPQDYLRRIAGEALEARFGPNVPEEYRRRLQRELEVIEAKGYSSYILIVHDMVQYARANGIPCGARGSACATLLGAVLGIVQLDPIRYGLLFERWTDPQRDEDPDIDVDICQEGRGKVLQYVRQKYGHVAQIITYGTLKARAAVRDVGRVLGMPLPEVDSIAKLVPEGLKVTLASALEAEPELRRRYESDVRVRDLIDHARKLEGLCRHASVHAAGVIVADEPLEDLVPLCKQADGEEAITQWDGPTCDEKAGLMKMDFLGLRTLTILQRARELVRRGTGKDIDPEGLPVDDPQVYRLFCEGRTDGVFQFESDGMRNILVEMKPARIEDLIAANAMYRPGPMELIATYCARKHGREEVPSVHPRVDDILQETHGIMVYQEQVMQVLSRLGGLPLNRALTLIKAISKKKPGVINEERPNFVAGAMANGIARQEAERLFELILKFAGYGFNKAHSARYAIVAYQAAYFKAYHPREFLAATLTYECVDTDKVVQYMAEAERMGVKVGPPDINACGADFAVDGERVRFGLAAVKGVGAKAVEAIVEARGRKGRFTDLYDFCAEVDLRAVNRATIEALIKCGAFDSLGAHRGAMMAALERAMQSGQSTAAARRSGQMNLFGAGGAPPAPIWPDVEPWSETQLLAAEKETLGFFITSHPLVKYARELDGLSSPAGVSLGRLEAYPQGAPVTIGCMIASVRPTSTRKDNKRMAMLTVEDAAGKADAVVFPRAYDTFAPLLKAEAMVFLVGTVDRRRDRPSILVDEVIPIDEALERLTGSVLLRLPLAPRAAGQAGQDLSARVVQVLAAHRGRCPVLLSFRPPGRPDVSVLLRADAKFAVSPGRPLVEALTELMGQENLVLRPRNGKTNNNRGSYGTYRRAGPANGGRSPAAARSAPAAGDEPPC